MTSLVVVSNRVPAPAAAQCAGGLAVGIVDALEDEGGLWLGWSGQATEQRSDVPHTSANGNIRYATVDLQQEDIDHYYLGYANSVLWPLLHTRLPAIAYCQRDWERYVDVNRYFATLLCRQLKGGETLWVHDYHFMLMAKMLREQGVTDKIGFFLHTPFPAADVFRALPNASEVLEALSHFDLIGVQTAMDLRNLRDCFENLARIRISPEGLGSLHGHTFRIESFPIGIEPLRVADMARRASGSEESQRLRDSLLDRRLIVGVDRLDYTKGLVDRFLAYERYLEKYRTNDENDVVFLQITPPSRASIPEYIQITETLERQAGHINGLYNRYDKMPLRYLNQQFDRETLLGFFSLSHVGLVTPLRDGMNLVAKEYVAAQPEHDPGVLILSSLAGAAEEMGAALVVNPYDKESVADGIEQATTMPLAERRQRWESLMETLLANTATHWREKFLRALQAPHRQPVRPRRIELFADQPGVQRPIKAGSRFAPDSASRSR